MARESFGKVVKRRLQGVVFLAVVASLITLSIAIYNKAFTDTVDVTLKADHTGNQLLLESDVKIRGIIVGSVADVKVEGDINDPKKSVAVVKLELDPDRVHEIPSNVTAQILPKTLFGEQYVALSIPTDSSGKVIPARDIRQGDIIPQNRSKGALEAQTVLDHLFPLLNAVAPADLNATLTAVATALKGRGQELGRTLVNMDRYLKAFNPHTKQLVDDLKKLGQVAEEYNGVAPDLLESLHNLQTSAKTVIAKRQALDALFTTGSDTSAVLQSFLAENKSRLIQINDQNNKIFPLLAQYSPEFTCLFAGINILYKGASAAIYNHQIHLSATTYSVPKDFGKYNPGEQPRILTGLGPACFGLPGNPTPVNSKGYFQIPDRYKCLNDGAALTQDPCAKSGASLDSTAINSPQEDALVRTLISGPLHTTPDKVPDAATILAAPLLRGGQVVVK